MPFITLHLPDADAWRSSLEASAPPWVEYYSGPGGADIGPGLVLLAPDQRVTLYAEPGGWRATVATPHAARRKAVAVARMRS